MIRSTLMAAALLTLGVMPDAQTSPTGTIVGRVTLTSRVRGSGLPSTIYQPRAVTIHQPAATTPMAQVVVSLKGAKAPAPLAPLRREIRQTHEEFIPSVVAVTRGSTIDFPNADPVFHNVFSLASAATFDLGRYPMGKSKSATFSRTGVVKVFCHIHSQMSASILVLDHPYFATPDADGTFVLPHVPVGTYTVAGWHERVGERIVSVTVIAGETTKVSLSLPVEDTP